MDKTGLLVGKKAIQAFLDDASEHALARYVKKGMPVMIENGRWLAHKENLEEFFKTYTNKKTEKVSG